ncbi:Reverse transcriptase [Theobroma cacao]|nr:Reverse transcriptase [Theobroma cacao]
MAIQEELDQFRRTRVWSLVPRPSNHPIVGSKWVFRNRINDQGNVVRNKARLVVKGYNQEEGMYYDETFTSVARIEAISKKQNSVALSTVEAEYVSLDIFGHCMQRRNNLNLIPFDLEIERTFRRRLRENLQVAVVSQTMVEDNNNNGNNAINLVPEANRAL